MEKVVISSISKPPMLIQKKQETPPEFTPKPSKSSSISFPAQNPRPDNITDSYLSRLCKKGRLSEALSALDTISQNGGGSKVGPKTFADLLQSCIDSNSVDLGRKLHAQIDLVEEKTPFLETKLLGMYAKCGHLSDARKVFDEMTDRDLYAWSAMIGACSRDQRWKEVVDLFYMMILDGVLPDEFLLPKILQACGNCGDIRAGKLIHSLVVKCGMGSYPRVNNSILSLYAKCRELGMARKFFESMDKRDRVAWNAMISGCCQNGEIEEAHRLFNAMCNEGIQPGLVTWNILISGYNQIGYCDLAMEFMRGMGSSGLEPDVVAWTSMISGFAQNNRTNEALDLFKEMVSAGVEPNGVTIASAISACASLKVLNNGMELHSLAYKMGSVQDVLVGNSLIDMYSKCGDLEAAKRVFDMMLEKDVCTWNSMIGGYCLAGYCGKAYVLFVKMEKSDIRPNVITWNTMISAHILNGDEDHAMDLFHRMEKEGNVKRDTASWNTLIAGFLQTGKKEHALNIFCQMQSLGVSPNHVTIVTILPACSSLISLKNVKEIHGYVLRRNLDSALKIANALIDAYAKSGNLEYSRAIFERKFPKDLITWNSMLAGYVLHGCSDAALDLIDQMRNFGPKPSRSTFVNIILAHGIAKLMDEGKQVFSSMMEDYQIVPRLEHYAAMIDLYGRLGRLKEAMKFIEDMPIEPDSSVWSALFKACMIHGNFSLAVRAGENLLDLEPENSLIHHLVLQAYLLCGKTEDSFKVKRLEMENKALKKLFGQSWIEVRSTMHCFFSGDQSKLDPGLLSWVDSISREAKAQNAHSGFCIEEEEKEDIVGVHSEKLALAFAFAFVSSPSAPQSIRIVKNLRMCGDCHTMAKYISLKYGCEIYLSDSKCLHHFRSGHCSCGDYW